MFKRLSTVYFLLVIFALAVTLFFGLKFFNQKIQKEQVVFAPEAKLQDLGPAPDFKVKLLDSNKEVSLKDFKGKPLIINFWASWCPSCREEAPILAKVAKEHKSHVTFLGIIVQDTEAQARAYLKEFGVTYQNGWDVNEQSAQAYKITGVPETYFIDSQGNLRAKWIGAINEENLQKLVNQLQGS